METDNKTGTFEAFNPGLTLIVLIKVNISTNCSNSKETVWKCLTLRICEQFLQPVLLPKITSSL